jgi:hypothetical protein
MHLYKKWPKYAFAYTHMQMHNYLKPIHHYIQCNSNLLKTLKITKYITGTQSISFGTLLILH